VLAVGGVRAWGVGGGGESLLGCGGGGGGGGGGVLSVGGVCGRRGVFVWEGGWRDLGGGGGGWWEGGVCGVREPVRALALCGFSPAQPYA